MFCIVQGTSNTVLQLSTSLVIATKFTGGPYIAMAMCVLIATRLLLRRRYAR
jgi:hypothetical protein